MDRKKTLKKQYLENRPDMGIYGVSQGNNVYISGTKNLGAALNRTKFDLTLGNFRQKQAQQDYTAAGGQGFVIEIVETLPYDTDDSKTDYADDLYALLDIIAETLRAQGKTVYTF